MPVCDVCNSPVNENTMQLSTTEFMFAVHAGLRPAASLLRSSFPANMSIEEAFSAWCDMAKKNETDWLLCSDCSAGAKKALDTGKHYLQINAAKTIADQAYELNKQHEGHEILSGFLSLSTLQEYLLHSGEQFIPPVHLNGKELSAAYAKFCQEHDLFGYIVKGLLENIARQDVDVTQELAFRICEQIRSDEATRGIYRKPLHYVETAKDGLAIAIAIDDRFWTDEW